MPAALPPTAAELVAAMPFAASLGIALTEAAPQRVRGSVSWAEDRCTLGLALHGGVLMSLADTVGAICAYLNLPRGSSTATVESKTNFFRAARGGAVHAVAHPVHVGRSFIVVQTDLTDGIGRPIAQTTQTQAVLEPARNQAPSGTAAAPG